jgi:transposase InsO family protein
VANYKASCRLELVHGNLCGPVMPMTPGGNRYIFLLDVDLIGYMWVTLLRSKDQAMTAFMEFQVWAEAEAERKLGTFRTDYGGEFTTRTFLDYCAKMGIQRHLIAPYTLKQNGIMERRNQTIMSMARSMLKAMTMLGWLWGEAVVTSVHILNRC